MAQRRNKLERMQWQGQAVLARSKASAPEWYTPARGFRGADIPALPVDATFAVFRTLMDTSSLLAHDYFRHDRRTQDARTNDFLARTPWQKLAPLEARLQPVLTAAEQATDYEGHCLHGGASSRNIAEEAMEQEMDGNYADEVNIEAEPGDYDLLVTNRLTGERQQRRIQVRESLPVTVDIEPA